MSSDELFDEARRVVIESQNASIAFLQRRLMISFARAARLMDDLEIARVVSDPMFGAPRAVLVAKERA